ncbi:sentrin/sumo-specific protease senp7 [Anopheles darlingi]|uniref:Sentrin/sumo-specific protease senp7 n=1 Tax=Anopheles darlingi TaxID=43151 RepID=W5J4M9_ANODA|nr:sentrin/sumo-specific protease senp7 [Anopheles darlingi]
MTIKKERPIRRMLIILQNGEMRLIIFKLPKMGCTVQELLEQLGVQYSPESNIQCFINPGGYFDYIVTVDL